MVKNKHIQRVMRGAQQVSSLLKLLFCLLFSFFFTLKPVSAEFGSIVDIGLAGDLYFTDQSVNNGQGFVDLLIQNTWSDSQIWVDVGAGGLVGDTATSYVKAPQLFYRMGNVGNTHLTLGRMLHDWSFSDDFWNLGLTQPLFKWSEARPEQQGLTGLFLTLPLVQDKLEATFFYSSVFLPTQGPSYDLSNGKITSSNPWFSEPVEVIDLSGEKADLAFEVDVPKTQDVVFGHHSYGAQLSTPRNKKDLIFNVFAMDKPKNDLILPFEGVLNLSTFNGDVRILPRVARHTVAGLDFGWNFENFKSVFSVVHESEVDYDIPDGTTYPIIPEQNIFSFTQLIRLSGTQRLWLGYVNVDRQHNEVGGTFAGSQVSTFLYRNRFEEAVRVKWEGLMFKRQSRYRINASFAYNQSLVKDNVWLSSDIRWSIYKGIEAFTQCDFFGGSENEIASVDFMSTFLNNDRCLVGGHYAF